MDHRALVVDQFTKQAEPFANAPGIRDEEALRLLVTAAGAGPADEILDVACGPGLVVAAFAAVVRQATGVDVTPAMIAQAERLAAARGLTNVTWRVADVLPLPFPDAAFSLVVSRFAFHHFETPGAVLAEMRRVCRPGGRVVVADVIASRDARKAATLNRMETLRDPSHVRALPLAELSALFPAAGLPVPATHFYNLESDLEGLLSRSFPNPGDEAEIRRLFEDAVADDALGMAVRRRGDRIRFAYPIAILVATRA
jgi:ubiquinone/menaquinone biosynthesis C-methylase UbiE